MPSADLAADAGCAAGSTGPVRPTLRARLRRASGHFWLAFMFWWTEHAPRVVLLTRPFFLWFAFRYSKVLRDGPLVNARRLLGPSADESQCRELGREIVRNFYLSVYELGVYRRLSRDQLLQRIDGVEGRQLYLDARAARRGAIFVTAHLGTFELGVAALADHEKRIHVVFQRDEIPRFDRLRSDLRRRLGVVEAPVDDGLAGWVRLRDALLRDEVVMVQGDRVMPGQRGTRIPFLGGHILMPTGPVKLAIATGAPIIPVFSIRTRVGRARIVIEEPIHVEPNAVPVDGRHPAMLRLAELTARHVQANPRQWLMVYRVWCEDADEPIGT